MEILKIYLEKRILIRYYVIKHLILLEIQNMMDTSVDLRHWLTPFLIKTTAHANKSAAATLSNKFDGMHTYRGIGINSDVVSHNQ